MVTAAKTDNYQSPGLAQHAFGNALAVLIHGLYTNQRNGVVTKGEPILHPRVASITPATGPTQAAIVDCFDDTHWLNYKTSGGLQNDIPGGRHRTTAVVQNEAGVWKVTQLHVERSGTC